MIRPLPLWRRLGAVAALLALLFASIAVLPHAMAAPAAMQAEAVHVHEHGDDHAAAHPDSDDPVPCETGCVTCKDCALCSFATTVSPVSLAEGCDFQRYASSRVPAPADVYPPGLIKPPRL